MCLLAVTHGNLFETCRWCKCSENKSKLNVLSRLLISNFMYLYTIILLRKFIVISAMNVLNFSQLYFLLLKHSINSLSPPHPAIPICLQQARYNERVLIVSLSV